MRAKAPGVDGGLPRPRRDGEANGGSADREFFTAWAVATAVAALFWGLLLLAGLVLLID